MQRLARAKDWLIHDEGQLPLDRAPPRLSRLHRRQDIQQERQGRSASAASSACSPRLRTARARAIFRCCVTRCRRSSTGRTSTPAGHRGKALMHILDTFPRDELFESTIADLARTVQSGILNLQDRQTGQVFPAPRYLQTLLFLHRLRTARALHDGGPPQDRGCAQGCLRRHIGRLERADIGLAARSAAYDRAHTAGRTAAHQHLQNIEQRIGEVIVSWSDKLRAEMREAFGDDEGHKLFRTIRQRIPCGLPGGHGSAGRLQRHQLD